MTELSPLRAGRITGSRIGSILGLKGAFKSRSETLREMVRQYHQLPDEFQGNEMTEYGQLHEPDALAAYTAETGFVLHGSGEIVLHPFYEFLGYTPDALVLTKGMVEAKVPSHLARWKSLADKPTYEAQIRLGLECTGREWCDFIIWYERRPLSIERVHYDQAWLPSVLPRLQAFMADYEAAIADPAVLAREIGRGVAIELAERDAFLSDRARWKELAAQEAAIARELLEVKARVAERLGDNEIGTLDGKPVAKWVYRNGASIFDRASFKKEHADLEAQYTKNGEPTRFPALIDDQEGEVA